MDDWLGGQPITIVTQIAINAINLMLIPQTELVMRGSYGVAKEGGYELFPTAVALAGCCFLL